MTDIEQIEQQGYKNVRQLPDGTIIGVMRLMYTTGLFVGLTPDTYSRRYCYETLAGATDAVNAWNGAGDPPGPWVKEKPSGRLWPGATT